MQEMNDNRALLEGVLEELGLEAGAREKGQLLQFAGLLLEGLKKQRLVGEKTAAEIIGKHFYDSLVPASFSLLHSGAVLDLGTGAGFPGLPLKIISPGTPFFLLEANGRKINFLKNVVAELGLAEVFLLHGRAEKIGQQEEYRERFGTVLSRAVAHTSVLLELSLPLASLGGRLVFFKGPRAYEELERSRRALELCGGRFKESREYCLPSGEKRVLLIFEKVASTPPQYPRRDGVPLKRPLDRLE